jgi:Tfp pilus assembly protein PilZ
MPSIKVSINFSSIQFFEHCFVENIIKTIYEFGLDPSFLIMEITESALLDKEKKAVSDIKMLKSYGIQIALDDFGTGFSSLAYLHSFDIDILKIDGSFTRNSIVDAASEVIIRSIINMALELELQLVAEGIENTQQLTYLQKQNCYIGQGYLFSKPLPVDVFEGVLSQKVCCPRPHCEPEPRVYKERRQSARISLPDLLEADLSILELNKKKVHIGNTKVFVKNIGPGGLCFITNVRMPVDKGAILQFAAQISGKKIQVTGSAVWINSLGSGLYEYGVRFEFKENEKLELLEILNQVQEGMKHGPLISEDIPASGKDNYTKEKVSEGIYEEKKKF